MATMKDIATRLGVSLSTVSKGLNGGQDISDSLRQTILDTAVEVGYINRKAKKQDTRSVAVFIENMEYEKADQFGYDIVLGFQQAAYREKWGVTIIPADHTLQKKHKYDAYMLQGKYSAAFFMGFSLDDPWMNQLADTSIPTVLLDNFIPINPKVSSIGTDSEEGIDMAIDHLARLGHEKIAFLNGSAGSTISNQRMLAYLNSMARHHLPIDTSMAVYGYFVAEAAKYHVPGFLDQGATAILCGNDLIASGVIQCCNDLGYSVPGDISVIGFDDIPLAANLRPALTTIAQNRNELGQCAYYTLHAMIHNVSLSKNLLRPNLILRDSTAIAKPRLVVRRSNDKDTVDNVNPELYSQFAKQQLLK
ncbi:MAG: LacI family transcriptional regulator [Lachnospiraceae bacterium]|nr:LacI family transcriptional regulator [Lachnospiraceae bacterium]